jgi:hypothetical protein
VEVVGPHNPRQHEFGAKCFQEVLRHAHALLQSALFMFAPEASSCCTIGWLVSQSTPTRCGAPASTGSACSVIDSPWKEEQTIADQAASSISDTHVAPAHPLTPLDQLHQHVERPRPGVGRPPIDQQAALRRTKFAAAGKVGARH